MRKGRVSFYPDRVAGSHLIRTCPVPEQPDETRLANPDAVGLNGGEMAISTV
jgi:hypothetical protein